MELTKKRVNEIFNDCLFEDNPKEGTEFIPAIGIVTNVGFDPNKIEEHSDEIKGLLDELPSEFNESEGEGWSFLKACMRKDNVQWGEHQDMEQLLMLGLGSG